MGIRKGGNIPAIPEETRIAMKEMRNAGKTIKEIADFYHVSQNSVLKYTGGVSDDAESSGASIVQELDVDVQDLVLGQHAKRVLNQSKKLDADTVHAGEALREYFKTKGIDVDLRKIPMDQLIKLVKSPGVYEGMGTDVKDIFNNWLLEKVNKGEPVLEKLDGNGKISFNDVKEILMLKFLMKMAGEDGDSPQGQNIIAEMRAENEKQRLFYEKKIEDMESKLRDMVLERRFQDVEDRQLSLSESLETRLADISAKIENYREVAVSGSNTEKLDAITHIEQLAAERERVNKAMEKLNQSQVMLNAPAAPGAPDIYKKPDGSTDYARYAGDKLESSIKMITDALSKRTPDKKEVVETPAPEPRVISMDEAEHFYQQLLQKPSMTPVETDWINRYLPVRAQYFPAAQPRETPVADDTVSSAVPDPVEVEDPVEEVEQKRESVLDRLREAENEEIRRAADLGSIGL